MCLHISDVRVRAKALTVLASAANSMDNMELITIIKELVLPQHISSKDQPMETNGKCVCTLYICMCITCIYM